MLKSEVRKLVLDRMPMRYPKSAVTVLGKLLDLTYIPDWRKDQVEDFVSQSKSHSSLSYMTNLDSRTVAKALAKLTTDGVINAVPNSKGSYKINAEAIKMFASKYLTKRSRQLESKILNAVRMKFARNPARMIPPFASEHPVMLDDQQTCKCARFCSYTSQP
jgi:hypothetical protein